MESRFAQAALPLTVVASLAAGCATYEPQPLDPLAELAALDGRSLVGLKVERKVPDEGAEGPPGRFDPSDGLDELEVVAVALTLNPELKAKRLEIGEAQALLVQAGLWPNPEIDLAMRPGLEAGLGTAMEADLLFELLRTGERAAREDVANARIEQVRAEIAAEEWEAVAKARSQRLAVLAGEQTIVLLDQEAALRERALELVRRRREVGEGTELDVSTAELEVAELRRDRRRVETDLELARRELNRLLGLPPGYHVVLSDSGKPLVVTVYEDLQDGELGARVARGRFDLRALEASYAGAEHELRLAVLRQYPSLRLGPSWSHEEGSDNFLGLAAGLQVPLFDRNEGEIAEKRSARDRARAAYAARLHELRGKAFEARTRIRRTRMELEAQEAEVLPLVQRNQDLFERAARAGELVVLDWVTALQRALRARAAHLETLVRYQEAVIEFEAALGVRTPPLEKPTKQE
jgi:outer membrane protein, heavy metal efflux system